MGETFEFRCANCDYRAEVGGGIEWGMGHQVTTYSCTECRKLYDVETARGVYGFADPQPIAPHCPRRKRHQITPWNAGDACPRCGTPMPPGESIAIWD